jgi:hypothetical protein
MQESVIEKAEDEGWVTLEWSVAHDPLALYMCRVDTNSRRIGGNSISFRKVCSTHVNDDEIPALPRINPL